VIIYGMTGTYWPFALCNIATGVIVGIMNKKGYFETGIHITITILSVTLANALLGSYIAVLVFGGGTGVGIDYIVSAFLDMGSSLLSSAFWARIPTNLVDKMITVYAAFGVKYTIKHIPQKA
jgi:energy-coupling factor transport system substrate-specific component